MDTLWSDLTIDGIELEECELSREDFERLFYPDKETSTATPIIDTIT